MWTMIDSDSWARRKVVPVIPDMQNGRLFRLDQLVAYSPRIRPRIQLVAGIGFPT
jgi:hypothetical protein